MNCVRLLFNLNLSFNNHLIKIQFTYHNVHPWKVSNSVVFSEFTDLHSHHYLLLDHFHQKSNMCPLVVILHSLLPPAPATTSLLSVSVDFPILDVAYKGNHIICGLLYVQFQQICKGGVLGGIFQMTTCLFWWHSLKDARVPSQRLLHCLIVGISAWIGCVLCFNVNFLLSSPSCTFFVFVFYGKMIQLPDELFNRIAMSTSPSITK